MGVRDVPAGLRAAGELKAAHPASIIDVLELDISKPESITKFVADVNVQFGNIDILVNNAAIAFKNTDPTPFKDQAEPTFKTNFFGTLQLTQGLLPAIKASSRKVIVNVASMAGHLRIFPNGESNPLKAAIVKSDLTVDELVSFSQRFVDAVKNERHTNEGWPNTCYGTSKCVLIALTKVLARAEPSVTINACCPGWCSTDMSSHSGSKSAAQGAETPVMLANLPNGSPSGRFYSEGVEIEW